MSGDETSEKNFIKFISLVDKINRILEYIVIGLLGLLTVAVVAQIMSRIFRFSLSWIEELVRYLLIWMAIFGSALATHKSALINVDLLLKILSRKAAGIVAKLSSLISALFVLVVIYSSFSYIKVGIGQMSPALKVEMSYLYVVIPVGFGIMFLNILASAMKHRNVDHE